MTSNFLEKYNQVSYLISVKKEWVPLDLVIRKLSKIRATTFYELFLTGADYTRTIPLY